MNWFESRPLFGQTIAVTRTRQQASDLSSHWLNLRRRHGSPDHRTHRSGEWSQVDEVLEHIAEYDWVIFTSQNGVKFAKQRLLETGCDSRAFAGVNIAAIGDATAAAVGDELCLRVELCPKEFVAEALADEFEKRNEVRGRHFLLRPCRHRPAIAARKADRRRRGGGQRRQHL